MIQFITPDAIAATINECAAVIIPVAIDSITESPSFKSLAGIFPELPAKYTETMGKSSIKLRPGFVTAVKLDSISVYIMYVREVGAYQTCILDIVSCIVRTLSLIKDTGGKPVMVTPFTLENTKLSESIMLPVIANEFNSSDFDIRMVSEVGPTTCAMSEYGVRAIDDVWKPEWCLVKDDAILVAVINDLTMYRPNTNLSKSSMIKIYKIACDEGLFPNIEWTDGEYGPYFKKYMYKLGCLLNHGLLIDAHRASNAGRTSYRIGPIWPMFTRLANTMLLTERSRIRTIAINMANKLREDQKQMYKDKQAGKSTASSYPSNNSTNNSSPAW